MSNGVASQAKNAANTTGGVGANLSSQGNNISGALLPELEQNAKGEGTGIAPTDLEAMKTSAAETAGGATGAADEKAKLASERTGNAASLSTSLDENARNRARVLADTNLKIQGENSQVKLNQQDSAQKELGQLYGTDVSGANKAYDTQSTDIKTEATPPAWLTDMEGISSVIANGAKAASGMGWTPFSSAPPAPGGAH